jgi:predicted TIM-barrel fold metal-dependent hydrolase
MHLIDVHAHAFSPAYVALLERMGASEEVLRPARYVLPATREDAFEQRLAIMDGTNVERQVLSMSGLAPYFLDSAAAIEGAQFLNNEHASICRNLPSRFSFFATLPMPHVDAALEEIQRAYDDLGAVGVTFTTSILARPLSDPAFEAVFEELNRRKGVVFLHPPGLSCGSPELRQSGHAWSIGAPLEDALCALQLMQAGFPKRYPELKIIVPHLGGFLPFLRYRLDLSAAVTMRGQEPPSQQMRKFWWDTANGEPDALLNTVHVCGADKVVFGSDYPFWNGPAYQHTVDYLELAGLSEVDLAAIRYDNAHALLGF